MRKTVLLSALAGAVLADKLELCIYFSADCQKTLMLSPCYPITLENLCAPFTGAPEFQELKGYNNMSQKSVKINENKTQVVAYNSPDCTGDPVLGEKQNFALNTCTRLEGSPDYVGVMVRKVQPKPKPTKGSLKPNNDPKKMLCLFNGHTCPYSQPAGGNCPPVVVDKMCRRLDIPNFLLNIFKIEGLYQTSERGKNYVTMSVYKEKHCTGPKEFYFNVTDGGCTDLTYKFTKFSVRLNETTSIRPKKASSTVKMAQPMHFTVFIAAFAALWN